MNFIEEINDRRPYQSTSEYHADLADPRYATNADFRQAIDNRLKRSQGTMTGFQAPTQMTGPMSVTISGGKTTVGKPADVDKALADQNRAAAEANRQVTSNLPKFAQHQVKSRR